MGEIVKYVCDKCGKEIDSFNYVYKARLNTKNIYIAGSHNESEPKFLCLHCYRDLVDYYNNFWKDDK